MLLTRKRFETDPITIKFKNMISLGNGIKKILVKYMKRNIKPVGGYITDYERFKENNPEGDWRRYLLDNYMKIYDKYDTAYISIGLKIAGTAIMMKDELFEEKSSDLFGNGVYDGPFEYRQGEALMNMYRNMGKELYDLADEIIGKRYIITKKGEKSKAAISREIRKVETLQETRSIEDIVGSDLYGAILKLSGLFGSGVEYDDFVRFVKTRKNLDNLSNKWKVELQRNYDRYLTGTEQASYKLAVALQSLYFQLFRLIRSPEFRI